MKLSEAEIGVSYLILSVDLPSDYQRHLANLGLKKDTSLKLLSKTKENTIIMLLSSRLAFDYTVLDAIDVIPTQGIDKTVALSELKVSDYAFIEGIYANKAIKRRLMDMGLTKGTKIHLRKVAPLGDPLEISLRGYELSIRKSEAQLISVFKIEDEIVNEKNSFNR